MRRIARIQVVIIVVLSLSGCGGGKAVPSVVDDLMKGIRPKALPVVDSLAGLGDEVWPTVRHEQVDQRAIDQLLLGISCDVAQKTLEKGDSLSRSDIVPIIVSAIQQQSTDFAIGRLAPGSGYEEYRKLQEFSEFVSENRTAAESWLNSKCMRV